MSSAPSEQQSESSDEDTAFAFATCELRWDFPEEKGMMQYSRDKYFPQL
jgi:hypothetical protein